MATINSAFVGMMITALIWGILGVVGLIWGNQIHQWWIDWNDRHSDWLLVQMDPFRILRKTTAAFVQVRLMSAILLILSAALIILFAVFGEYTVVRNPNDIIRKAIRAHGGRDLLVKYSRYHIRSNGTIFQGKDSAPIAIESWEQLPTESQTVVTIVVGGQQIKQTLLFNGKRVWYQRDGKMRDGTPVEVEAALQEAYDTYVCRLYPLLDDSRFTLADLGEVKVKDRTALGVKVSSKGYRDISLFFDKKSGLLLKTEQPAIVFHTEVLMERIFLDYNTLADGFQFPRRKITLFDQKTQYDVNLIGIHPIEKMPATDSVTP